MRPILEIYVLKRKKRQEAVSFDRIKLAVKKDDFCEVPFIKVNKSPFNRKLVNFECVT